MNEKIVETTQNFFDDKFDILKGIESSLLKDLIVDNGTLHISIKTPKGWKCDRKGCKEKYKHTHGIFSSLGYLNK